jgi:predicted nucleic acid-binding protein
VGGVRASRAVVLHVFIDTNVYLDFFRFGQDTLDALRKLATAIRDGHVKLWTTEQVRDELRRSREGRVDESLRALDELRPTSRMPSIARNLPDYQALDQARSAFDRELSDARQQLVVQFNEGELAADLVLEELLDLADTIAVTDEIVEAARAARGPRQPTGEEGVARRRHQLGGTALGL